MRDNSTCECEHDGSPTWAQALIVIGSVAMAASIIGLCIIYAVTTVVA